MDLISLLYNSSDDDDDDSDKGKGVSRPSETECTTREQRRRKVRRRGSIPVISSAEANASNVFSRSVPHRRGHWAGHIKVPILGTGDTDSGAAALRRLKTKNVHAIRNALERRGISGTMVEHDQLHASLSKHFSLQNAQIEPFVKHLTELLRQEPRTSVHVELLRASELETNGEAMILLNEDQTRSFFCWKVYPTASIRRIVAQIDGVLKRYDQPVYYEPASFHISIASFPGNIVAALENGLGNSSDGEPYSQPPKTIDTGQGHGDHSATEIILQEKDENDDDSSSSFEEENLVVPVHELACTLGTTKEFFIPLHMGRQAR